MAAHHPHLVRVQIVSTTAHRHQLLNVHHLKHHRVWTTTSIAAIWSTTNISSRPQRRHESVTTRSPTRWMAWGHRIFMTVVKETPSWTRERETMTTTMGQWTYCGVNSDKNLIMQSKFQLQHDSKLTRGQRLWAKLFSYGSRCNKQTNRITNQWWTIEE